MTDPNIFRSSDAARAEAQKLVSAEHRNANQFPKHFYCRHMQPGLCGYGTEKVLVDTAALKRMIGADAIGKPVYILHNESPNEERLKKLKEEAAGYITDSFYNELDGWAWFEFLAVDDAAHQAIAAGWAVSNAYIPTEWGPGGKKNNVPYDREIMSGVFTHLAIVPDPRYEDAVIMTPEKFKAYQDSKKRELEEIHNSQAQPKGKPMLKFLRQKIEEVTNAADATHVEVEGKMMTRDEAAQLLNSKTKKNSYDMGDEEMENAMIDCDGEKMSVKEARNRLTKFNSEKKNAEDEKRNAEEAAKKKEEEEKKNAEEKAAREKKEKEEAEEKERQNARFTELQNAHNIREIPVVRLETSMDKVQRGKDRY